ncbi:MAG: UDP-3-O-(3-hydroxymyristoyl)glucosamine N-acyltransferase [Puniceicoccales bacterium]|nr:UDP-3-O-(3-hydroxymyristoyl)glucosamine N-acyltransferase [Puniceicoccales bacterium]
MTRVKYSFSDIVRIVSPAAVMGGTECVITGVRSLAEASSADLSFLGNKKYREQLKGTLASIVLVSDDIDLQPRENQAFLVCKNPSFALGLLCRDVEEKYFPKKRAGIHGSAAVAASAKLGQDIHIGPHVVVEDNAEIGDGVVLDAGCYIGQGVSIGNGSKLCVGVKIMPFCSIGKNVILHPGVVVGSDGFGYETVGGIHEKLPQIGNVVIDDDVEVGANTAIDRARFSSTRIGAGTKIDNLVQIGHNVTIGKRCLIVAQVGIAGSTTVGDHVTIGGQSGIVGHIHIGDETMIAGQTGVTSSCKPGSFLRGSPAMPYGEANKFFACRKYLYALMRKAKEIENQLNFPE